MPKLNENYLQLKDSYLFSEIAHRTAAYSEKHPDKPVIRGKSIFRRLSTGRRNETV